MRESCILPCVSSMDASSVAVSCTHQGDHSAAASSLSRAAQSSAAGSAASLCGCTTAVAEPNDETLSDSQAQGPHVSHCCGSVGQISDDEGQDSTCVELTTYSARS